MRSKEYKITKALPYWTFLLYQPEKGLGRVAMTVQDSYVSYDALTTMIYKAKIVFLQGTLLKKYSVPNKFQG